MTPCLLTKNAPARSGICCQNLLQRRIPDHRDILSRLRNQTGDIISHISYDIDTLNMSLSHDFVQIMTSVYTVIGSLVFMWNISKPLIL